MNTVNCQRRDLLKAAGIAALSAVVPNVYAKQQAPKVVQLSDGTLKVLSDGYLSLPVSGMFSSDEQAAEAADLFRQAGLSMEVSEPPCNVTLWQTKDRIVLFDVGSGSQFMDTAGLLPSQLEAMDIDLAEVTDVVFTHAHPDHCWGLLDDFDELLCPQATYYMHGAEYDYWMSEETLNNTPESGLGMVAGARNRLPLIEPQLKRFDWGDEIIPGIEAVDTHGHTPGHTSFTIHSGSESLLVLGDALIHSVISFQKPGWKWRSDADPEAAIETRKRLLDRLVADQINMVAYHLPSSGYGHVERSNGAYQFVSR